VQERRGESRDRAGTWVTLQQVSFFVTQARLDGVLNDRDLVAQRFIDLTNRAFAASIGDFQDGQFAVCGTGAFMCRLASLVG
jgi:hypothetical protein